MDNINFLATDHGQAFSYDSGEALKPSIFREKYLKHNLGDGQYLTLVRRSSWGASPLVPTETAQHPFTHVLYQDTGSSLCASVYECGDVLRNLQATDMERGLPNIQYNFMVGADGKVYYGRGWFQKPSLPEEYAHIDRALSIGFVGDFKSKNPPFAMTFTALNLIKLGYKRGFLKPWFKLIQLKKYSHKM